MDSPIDTNTGVILPVSTTAYGLLFHKDRLGGWGQTRIKHPEKRRKTQGKKVERCTPLEGYHTLGGLLYSWRVTPTNMIYNLPISQRTYLSGK
jgi:hypothetical protein